jgi:hypothetical protein
MTPYLALAALVVALMVAALGVSIDLVVVGGIAVVFLAIALPRVMAFAAELEQAEGEEPAQPNVSTELARR